MLKIVANTNLLRWLAVTAILPCSFSTSRLVAAPPPSGPSAQPPYSLSVFAQSTDKYSYSPGVKRVLFSRDSFISSPAGQLRRLLFVDTRRYST